MKLKLFAVISTLVLISAVSASCCECEVTENPAGTLSVRQLRENPVYDTEVEIYGTVSLLNELLCPCFELTSGGAKVQVWYGLMVEDDGTERPPVSIDGIANGDSVIVTGELKSEGQYRTLNDFWASHIEKIERIY